MDRCKPRVFVVMASLILTQFCIAGSKGEALVHYKGNNFVECPLGSYQVEFSSNCTDVCPPHSPYKVLHLCMDICPEDGSYAIYCSHLVPQPTPARPVEMTATPCRLEFCPIERPYCFDYQCLSDCPHGTVNEDFSCVYHCSNIATIVYNNTCVADCPPDKPYNESGICVSKCSTYNVQHGNLCVRACPVDMFRYNKKCKTSCPQEASFVIEVLNTKFCIEFCPDFTSVDQNVCQLQCPKEMEFLWNKTCVGLCPASVPLIYVLKRRLPQFNIPICISTCPDDMFSDGISCVQTCDQHMYGFNSTCVDSCPSSHSLLEGGASPYSCVSECQSTQYLYDNHCTTTCPGDTFVFNRTCVSKCPNTNPLVVNQTCFSRCPNYLLNESGLCVSDCNEGYYIFNHSCVNRCPETHKYIYDRKCNQNCTIYNQYQWKDSCRYSCPYEATYIFNHTCLAVCPRSHPFYKRGRNLRYFCVSSCNESISQVSVLFDSECKCSGNTISYNFTCVEKCPSSHPYYATVQRTEPFYTHLFISYCLNTCADGSNKSPGKLIHNMTCVERCPNTTVLYGSKCVDKCPLDRSMIYTKEDAGNYIIACVENCPGTTFMWGQYCYDQCPQPLASYPPNRTCLEQCPQNRRFRYQFRTNDNYFAFKCKEACDKYIVDNTTCVDVCPLESPFSLGQTCVSKCSATHMFIEVQSQRCLTACKPPLVELNHTCISVCPSSIPFVFNNTCVEKCPSNFDLTSPSSQGPTCVNECNHPLLRENNKCTPACPDKFIVNNVCEDVLGCPKEYRYKEYSTRGPICRKVCLDIQFVFDEIQCMNKCPKFAFGNQCVDKCPQSHLYTFNKDYTRGKDYTMCHSICPSLTFDRFCVDHCPGSYIMIQSNRRCVEKCPASDPFKTGSECVKTCPLTEMVSSSGDQCIPMSSGYITAITLLGATGICFAVRLCVMYRRKPICGADNIRDDSTVGTVDESSECEHDTGTDSKLDPLTTNAGVGIDHEQSQTESAFEGEMHINEETHLKENII